MCSQADSSRLPHPRFGYSETQGAHDWSQSPCPPFWTAPVFNRGGLQITSCQQACCLSCPTGPSCAHTCLFLPLRRPCHRSASVKPPRPREPLVLEWKEESLGMLLGSDSCLTPAGSGPSAPCAEENLPVWSELPGRQMRSRADAPLRKEEHRWHLLCWCADNAR